MVDRVTVLLRMLPELHARVRKAAGRDSVNAWILDAVREHLDDEDRLKVSLLRKSVQAAVGKENVATRLRERLRQMMDTNTRGRRCQSARNCWRPFETACGKSQGNSIT